MQMCLCVLCEWALSAQHEHGASVLSVISSVYVCMAVGWCKFKQGGGYLNPTFSQPQEMVMQFESGLDSLGGGGLNPLA